MEQKQTAVEWFYQRILAKDIESVFEQAKEMEKQQIIDAYNQEICSHPDKEFVSGVFGGYWCPKCNKNVDSELEQE